MSTSTTSGVATALLHYLLFIGGDTIIFSTPTTSSAGHGIVAAMAADECIVTIDQLRTDLDSKAFRDVYQPSKCTYDASQSNCDMECICSLSRAFFVVAKKRRPNLNVQELIDATPDSMQRGELSMDMVTSAPMLQGCGSAGYMNAIQEKTQIGFVKGLQLLNTCSAGDTFPKWTQCMLSFEKRWYD